MRRSPVLCGQEGCQRLAPPFFKTAISRSLLRGRAAAASLSFALLIFLYSFKEYSMQAVGLCSILFHHFAFASQLRSSLLCISFTICRAGQGGSLQISSGRSADRLQLCIVPRSPETFKYSFSFPSSDESYSNGRHDRSDSSGKLDSTSCGFNNGQTC